MLDARWNEVLDTKEKYGGNCQTKSYPKRKLLSKFDDEAIAPIPPNNRTDDQQDRPPSGRDRATNNAAHKSAPPLHKEREVATQNEQHDLREDLDKRVGITRSIYGS